MSNKPDGSLDLQICNVIVVKEIKQLFKRSLACDEVTTKEDYRTLTKCFDNFIKCFDNLVNFQI